MGSEVEGWRLREVVGGIYVSTAPKLKWIHDTISAR